MSFLSELKLLEPISRYEWGWGSAMRDYVFLPSGDAAPVSMETWVHEKAGKGGITAAEVAQKYGVERYEVTLLLRKMREQHLLMIDPSGSQRGPNTRWVLLKNHHS